MASCPLASACEMSRHHGWVELETGNHLISDLSCRVYSEYILTKLSIGPSVGRYSVFRVALPHFLSALDLALHNKLFAHFNLTEIKANLKSWGNILMLLCSY